MKYDEIEVGMQFKRETDRNIWTVEEKDEESKEIKVRANYTTASGRWIKSDHSLFFNPVEDKTK